MNKMILVALATYLGSTKEGRRAFINAAKKRIRFEERQAQATSRRAGKTTRPRTGRAKA